MTDSELLSSGITSLSEALALSIGLLDGDITTTTDISNDNGKSNEDTKLSPSSNNNKQKTPITKSISILQKLQTQISHSNLISNNELLDDISTSTLELLSVDYHLGRAFLLLPTYFPQPSVSDDNDKESNGRNGSSSLTSSNSTTTSPSKLRKQNVIRAMEYYHSYLKRLEQLSENNNNKDETLLSDDTIKEYHTYLDMDDMNSDRGTEENDSNERGAKLVMNPSQIREMKIQRYKRKKTLSTQTQLLQSKLQQRTRLNISHEETFDNHNYESLIRTLYIEQLKLYAEETLDELYSSRNELDMLDMSIKMEESRMLGMGDGRMNRMSSHAAAAAARMSSGSNNGLANGSREGSQQQQPMSMTQITQNPLTGELEYAKQEISNGQLKSTSAPQSTILPQRQNIKEGIFKPSWNLPTMSLDELADKERTEAIQRSNDQKLAEEQSIYKPKRYDQLVKDGLEDNEELVEASAQLDREWDDWKEENPRGCGNKMSERGDRNF